MKKREIVARICAFTLAASLIAADALPAFAAAVPEEPVVNKMQTEEENFSDEAVASTEDTEAENIAETEMVREIEPESETEMSNVTETEPEMVPVPATGENQETISDKQENNDGLIYVNDALYNGYYMDGAGDFYIVSNGAAEPVNGMVSEGTKYYSLNDSGMMTLLKQTVFVSGKAYTGYYMDNAGILYKVSNGAAEPETGIMGAGAAYYSSQANGVMKLSKQTVFVAGKIYTGYYLDGAGILYTVSDGEAEPETGTVNAGVTYYSFHDAGMMTLSVQTVFVAGKAYTGYYLDSGNGMYSVKEGIRTLKTGVLKAGTKYYNYKTGEMLTLSKKTLYVSGKVYSGYYMDSGKKMYHVKKGTQTLKTGTLKAGTKYYSYNTGMLRKLSKQTLYVKGKAYTGYYMDGKKKMYSVKKGTRTLKTGTVKAKTKYYSYSTGKTRKLSKQTLYVKGKAYTGYYMDSKKKMYSVKKGTQTLLNAMLDAGTKYYSYKEKKTLTLSAQTLYVNGKVYTGYYLDSGNMMYSVSGGNLTLVNTTLNAGTEYYSYNARELQALSVQTVYVYGKAMEGMSAESLATLQRAQAVVAGITNDSMTKEEKLKVCFDYVRTYPESRPRMPHYKGMDWPVIYADDMFVRGTGNCCSYAAAFAYMAKAIGYEEVYCCNSGGHGWAEIDGLVYDPEWSMHHHVYSYYALSYDTRTDQDYKGAIGAGYPWMRIKI